MGGEAVKGCCSLCFFPETVKHRYKISGKGTQLNIKEELSSLFSEQFAEDDIICRKCFAKLKKRKNLTVSLRETEKDLHNLVSLNYQNKAEKRNLSFNSSVGSNTSLAQPDRKRQCVEPECVGSDVENSAYKNFTPPAVSTPMKRKQKTDGAGKGESIQLPKQAEAKVLL